MEYISDLNKIYFRLKKNRGKKNPTYRAQFFHEEERRLYTRIRNGKEYREYRAKVLLTRDTGQTNKLSAEKVAKRWLREGHLFSSSESISIFFTDFWNPDKSEYLRLQYISTGKKYSAVYLKRNLRSIELYWLPYCEARAVVRMNQLTKSFLKEWWLFLSDKLSNSGKSARTKNIIRQAVFVALNYAVKQDLIPDITRGICKASENAQKKISQVVRGKNLLEREKAAELFCLEHWHRRRKKYLVRAGRETELFYEPIPFTLAMFCFITGARLGEARGLRFKNLHLENNTVDIVENYQEPEGLKGCKFGSDRIGQHLSPILSNYLKKIIDEYLYPDITPEDYVFVDIDNRAIPIGKFAINAAIDRAVKNSNLDIDIRCHGLRHSFASLAAESLPFAVVQILMGHSSGKTTDIYIHETEKMRRQRIEFVDGLIPVSDALKSNVA